MFRDVYIAASQPDTHIQRVNGAALLLPEGAAFCGKSAALLWGARNCGFDGPVQVTSERRFGPVQGLKIYSSRLASDDIRTRWGLPVTAPLRTCWDLARTLPELEAVGWIDALGHARSVTAAALADEAARHRGEMGSVRASRVLALCDPLAESPPESHLRVHIVKAGLPTPTPQYPVMYGDRFAARVDLAWPHLKFAVEYDGQWHAGKRQLEADRARLRLINAAGWVVFHVTNADMRDVSRLLIELKLALTQRENDLAGKMPLRRNS